MANVVIDDTNLKNIASAIRGKNGTDESYKPSEMATAISNIEAGSGGIEPTGTLEIKDNGSYDVTEYANANVNVEKGIMPTGTIDITANGTYDVTNYASANVQIEGGEAYKPRYVSFAGYDGTELDHETQNLDTSELTSMKEMFFECTNLVSLAPKFDVTNVTSMYRLCSTDAKLETADFSGFGVSAVTSISYMCNQCTKLQSVDLSNFVTPNLTNCSYMFNQDTALTDINISKMITTNVTNMSYMFRGTKVKSLDLSHFETPNLTNVGSMFYQCSSLTYLDIRNFDFTKVTTYSNMLSGVPTTCRIIVKDDTAKTWLKEKFSSFTNIKTVAEL